MKALHYLASKGVPLRGDRESLIATILWFSPFGNKDLVLYPDAKWLGCAESRRRMFHWLDGTVEAIYAELKAMPISTLVAMLEDCMDQIVWDYGIERKVRNLPAAMADTKQWAALWNGFLGIETDGAWSNKAEIIETYAVENRWRSEAAEIIEVCEEVAG